MLLSTCMQTAVIMHLPCKICYQYAGTIIRHCPPVPSQVSIRLPANHLSMETRDRDGTTRFAKLPELGSSNFTSPFGVDAGDAKIRVWLSLPPPGRAQFAAAEMNPYS